MFEEFCKELVGRDVRVFLNNGVKLVSVMMSVDDKGIVVSSGRDGVPQWVNRDNIASVMEDEGR